jgi:hypothetical protein
LPGPEKEMYCFYKLWVIERKCLNYWNLRYSLD